MKPPISRAHHERTTDARISVLVSKDIQGLAAAHSIEELSARDWTEGPLDGPDEPAD